VYAGRARIPATGSDNAGIVDSGGDKQGHKLRCRADQVAGKVLHLSIRVNKRTVFRGSAAGARRCSLGPTDNLALVVDSFRDARSSTKRAQISHGEGPVKKRMLVVVRPARCANNLAHSVNCQSLAEHLC